MLTKQQLQEKIVRLQLLEAELSSGSSSAIRNEKRELVNQIDGCIETLGAQIQVFGGSFDPDTESCGFFSDSARMSFEVNPDGKLVNVIPDISYLSIMTGVTNGSTRALKFLTSVKTAIQDNSPVVRTLGSLIKKLRELGNGSSQIQQEIDSLIRIIGMHKAYATAFGQVSPSVAHKMVRYMTQDEVKSLLEVFGLEYREHGGKKWLRDAIRELDPTIAEEEITLNV